MACRPFRRVLLLLFAAGPVLAGRLPPLPPEPTPGSAWTFAVLGDNRGAEDGTVPTVFPRLLAAVQAVVCFVWKDGEVLDVEITGYHRGGT